MPGWAADSISESCACDVLVAEANQQLWGCCLVASDTVNGLADLFQSGGYATSISTLPNDETKQALFVIVHSSAADHAFELQNLLAQSGLTVPPVWYRYAGNSAWTDAIEVGGSFSGSPSNSEPHPGPLAQSSPSTKPTFETELSGSVEARKSGETIRVDISRLDQLLNTSGEMVITKARITQQIDDLMRAINRTSFAFEQAHVGSPDLLDQLDAVVVL